jgi:hypothetical protein
MEIGRSPMLEFCECLISAMNVHFAIKPWSTTSKGGSVKNAGDGFISGVSVWGKKNVCFASGSRPKWAMSRF